MKVKKQYQITRSYLLKNPPEKVWPLLSDMNRLFFNLGLPPAQKTMQPENNTEGLLKAGFTGRNARTAWFEEPFEWEVPYTIENTRYYITGFFKKSTISLNLSNYKKGSRLTVNFKYLVANNLLVLPAYLYLAAHLHPKLTRYLKKIDACAQQGLVTFEPAGTRQLSKKVQKTIIRKQRKIAAETGHHKLTGRLASFLKDADNEALKTLRPYAAAQQWGFNKYDTLDVFLHAARAGLLQFKWNAICPKCQAVTHDYAGLDEIENHLYCRNCNADYHADFSRNIELTFVPDKEIRKVTDAIYSPGGPQNTPDRVAQYSLLPGEKRYLNLNLEDGTYYFKTNKNKGFLKFIVSDQGDDTAEIVIIEEHFMGKSMHISNQPNLILVNGMKEKVFAGFETPARTTLKLLATEANSLHKFRTMFPNERTREGVKILASNLSILFTDIIDSTDLYLQEGDQAALDQVMNHFKVIQKVVAEEHGSIVKTIGDSAMAVFREPVSALIAMDRIHRIFSTSKALGVSVKLKAGIHYGNCTTVSINDRIDYFGTTVNMAARLVDAAKEKEIVISNAFYNNNSVKEYLEKNKGSLFVKDSKITLKGFDNEVFNVKLIRMEPSAMRLVI